MNFVKTSVNDRVQWVDFAKGLCIFAVVSLYSTKFTHTLFDDAGWLQYFAEFAKPFRMPDFFLLSGLFLARVIDRPWPGYLDKKILHYMYFFVLWTLISLALNLWVGDFKVTSALSVLKELWSMLTSWPFQMLWFIQMLAAYFLFAKMTNQLPKWFVLLIAIAIHLFPLPETGRIIIDEFFKRFVFFYIGYLAAPWFFLLAKKVQQNRVLSCFGILVWGGINWYLVNQGLAEKYGLSLILGISGATAIIAIGALVENIKGFDWLRYLGQNSIVIYLGFYWVMRTYFYFLKDIPILTNDIGTFCSVVTLLSILTCVVFYTIIRNIRSVNWLFSRPKWTIFAEYQKS